MHILVASDIHGSQAAVKRLRAVAERRNPDLIVSSGGYSLSRAAESASGGIQPCGGGPAVQGMAGRDVSALHVRPGQLRRRGRRHAPALSPGGERVDFPRRRACAGVAWAYAAFRRSASRTASRFCPAFRTYAYSRGGRKSRQACMESRQCQSSQGRLSAELWNYREGFVLGLSVCGRNSVALRCSALKIGRVSALSVRKECRPGLT